MPYVDPATKKALESGLWWVSRGLATLIVLFVVIRLAFWVKSPSKPASTTPVAQTPPNNGTPPVATAATGIDPKDFYIEFEAPPALADPKDPKGWSAEFDTNGPKDEHGKYRHLEELGKRQFSCGYLFRPGDVLFVQTAYDRDYTHPLKLPVSGKVSAYIQQFRSMTPGKSVLMYGIWKPREEVSGK